MPCINLLPGIQHHCDSQRQGYDYGGHQGLWQIRKGSAVLLLRAYHRARPHLVLKREVSFRTTSGAFKL